MQNHTIGSNYSFTQLVSAYKADPQTDADPHFLLYRGDEILALCLRHKFNPRSGEVWIGDDPAVAKWGEKLAALKDQKTVPIYHSQPGRRFYEYKGQYLITGDTCDPDELAQRKSSVPLSRIVFITPVAAAGQSPLPAPRR
jgi:hypothetical protein